MTTAVLIFIGLCLYGVLYLLISLLCEEEKYPVSHVILENSTGEVSVYHFNSKGSALWEITKHSDYIHPIFRTYNIPRAELINTIISDEDYEILETVYYEYTVS